VAPASSAARPSAGLDGCSFVATGDGIADRDYLNSGNISSSLADLGRFTPYELSIDTSGHGAPRKPAPPAGGEVLAPTATPGSSNTGSPRLTATTAIFGACGGQPSMIILQEVR